MATTANKKRYVDVRIDLDFDAVAEMPDVRVLDCASARVLVNSGKKDYFKGFDPWSGLLVVPKNLKVTICFGGIRTRVKLAEWIDRSIQSAHICRSNWYGFVMWTN